MRSPVPDRVAVELQRVVQRWQVLPLDHAVCALPAVLALAQRLADAAVPPSGSSAPFRSGAGGEQVPDLGPAAVMDQLRVLVYDLFAAPPAPCPGEPMHDEQWVRGELVQIRTAL